MDLRKDNLTSTFCVRYTNNGRFAIARFAIVRFAMLRFSNARLFYLIARFTMVRCLPF